MIEVPAPTDLTVATVQLTYSASDPAAATVAGTPPVVTPAAGTCACGRVERYLARHHGVSTRIVALFLVRGEWRTEKYRMDAPPEG